MIVEDELPRPIMIDPTNPEAFDDLDLTASQAIRFSTAMNMITGGEEFPVSDRFASYMDDEVEIIIKMAEMFAPVIARRRQQ